MINQSDLSIISSKNFSQISHLTVRQRKTAIKFTHFREPPENEKFQQVQLRVYMSTDIEDVDLGFF